MLLLPISGQYEQMLNAYYIEKLGLGISAQQLHEQVVDRFLAEADKPMPTNKKILWPDNDKFFEILQNQLNKLSEPISI